MSVREGRPVAEVDTARGSLRLVEPAPGVYYCRVDGSYSKELYDRGFDAPMTRELPRHESLSLFVDWWDLQGYDSAVRAAATEWVTDNRAKLTRTHIVMRSRLVATGVNTAAMLLTLRGIHLTVSASLDPFEKALEAAIRERK